MWLILFFACVISTHAWLPGVSPTDYRNGAAIRLKVNKLTSVKTQLPYNYYHLPYCRPSEIKDSAENLGEILAGDLIENSPYDLRMNEAEECKVVCTQKLDEEDVDKFKDMIEDDYQINWLVDNLPAAMKYRIGVDKYQYAIGFPVGTTQLDKSPADGAEVATHFLYNHVTILIKVHKLQDKQGEKFRVVGFQVEPKSVKHTDKDGKHTCSDEPLKLQDSLNKDVTFSYDVIFEESPEKWRTRWDIYLQITDSQIHWFSIVNSLMVVGFLSGMVAMILLRTLLRDIARYNAIDDVEDMQEESGWKLVHGDVFRKPYGSRWLCVFAGCGIQILGMTVVTLVFAAVGLLSPAYRGSLLQGMLLLFTFMGGPAGYTAARLHKLFNGEDASRSNWTTMLTALVFPGVCFAIFFVLDLMLWAAKSTGAVPFGTMFLLLVLWFGISLPLVFMGAWYGHRKTQIEVPVRTNQIPRQIPPQHWLTHPVVISLIGGVMPFGAVFTELFFIMSSIWQHQYYYLFGFLALVLVILVITCAEISIAFTYFQLAGEDYRWWWRAFLSSGSSSVYVFGYAVLYFLTRLNITKFVSTALYFGYMAMASYAFFLLTGTIGFLATLTFVKAIYGSIKVD